MPKKIRKRNRSIITDVNNMNDNKSKRIVDRCVDLKLLSSIDGNIGIDTDFRIFLDNEIDVILKELLKEGSMDTVDRTFNKVIATAIILYTKIIDVQEIKDLTIMFNRVCIILKETEKYNEKIKLRDNI